MGLLGLFTFSLWLIWFSHQDGKERPFVSSGSWIVVIWAILYASRPVSEWLAGIDQGAVLSQSRDEGSPIDGFISLALIAAGLIVLLRRDVRPTKLVKENVWLFLFYLFWMMSIAWSDYPFITFKRLFKDFGNIVMVLVILTDKEPTITIKAVIGRVAAFCIPLSVLLIRYYPNFGRQYVGYSQDELMYVGITTHKNTLGALAAVAAVFLLWDLLEGSGKVRRREEKLIFVSRILVLLLSWYVLRIANSATALVCAVLGTGLLVVFNLRSVRGRPGRVEAIGLCGLIVLVVLDSVLNVKEVVFQVLGRDMTLTSRTNVWPILLSHQDSPIVGAGFNTFWSGHRLLRLPESFQGMVQAHNGYLEAYLNGGLIGVGLLAALLFSAYGRIRKQLATGKSDGTIRLVVLLIAILYNNSEASFTKVGLMWLVTLYALMEYPMKPAVRDRISVRKDWSFDRRTDDASGGSIR